MTSGSQYKQDMPPACGYKPINFKRIPARTILGGWALIGGYIGVTVGAAYIYFLNYKAVRARDLEMKSASLALYPMLLAERDRAYLKQLRRNREEEEKLMANVEGWETGTWYGEPIYHTIDKNVLFTPIAQEYYIHSSYKDFSQRANISLYS